MNTIEIIAALKSHKVIPRLAGDQLKLTGETMNLPETLVEAVKARKEELILLLRNATDQLADAVVQLRHELPDYPATDAQKSLWMLHQLDEAGGAYNIVTGLYLKGTVSPEVLNSAFQACIQRHESLRTVFKEVDGGLRQIISAHISFDITFEDISGITATHDHLIAELRKLTYLRFDLASGPLLKVKLMRISGQEYAMVLVIHHIVSDGWSVRLLLQEVMHFYEAARRGEAPAIEPLRIQHKDYAAWLTRKLEGSAGQNARAFWKDQFSTDIDPLVLPADLARPGINTFEGAIARFFPGIHFYPRILQYCKQHKTTPFNFFLTTFSILLYKLSGQHTITIGTPVAGRTHFDLQQQIGLFVNALPLITQVNIEERFVDMLERFSSNTLRAFEFQDYPFARIAEDLIVKRDTGRNPLFDVMLVLQDTAIGDGRIRFDEQSDFELSRLDAYLYGPAQAIHENAPSKFDLTFNLGNDQDNKFYVEIEYSTRLFTKDNIILFYNAYQYIISQVLAHPEEKVNHLEIADQEELDRLETFNATAVPYALGKTVVDLFAEQVKLTPEHVAVKFEDQTYTYTTLDQLSSQLAAYLADRYAIGANDLVGIQLERSERMPLSVMAILKAGAAYVPIGMDYPAERVAYIIKDAQLKVLINEEELSRFFSIQDQYSKEIFPFKPSPGDLAYCIYTSGSTGTPKGVLNSHEGLFNRLLWMKDYLDVTESEVFLQKTPYTFDVSVWELLLPFMTGSMLVMAAPEKHKDAAYLQDVMAAEGVTIAHFVPSMLGVFLLDVVAEKCTGLHHIVCSGEELPATMVVACRNKLSGTRIHNLYGPTEAAIDVTAIDLTDVDVMSRGVSIGRPVANTRIYIVNESMQLQPQGVPGELLISGVQVARGYLHLEELTAARFIPDPFMSGNRVYRTGDIARWLPDGTIQYLGRRDDQVKIRGNRIELGEVEKALSSFVGIDQGIAAVKEVQGEKVLVAYLAARFAVDVNALRFHISTQLPDYMLPGYYVQLESLPLTSSGKVDKKRLPLPEGNSLSSGSVYEAPRNATELQLVGIWQDLLGKEQIGVKDNFFELGGHSLKATRLASQLYKVFNVKIGLKELFSASTIAAQAVLIGQAQQSRYVSVPSAPVQPYYPLSSSQRRLWVLSQFEEGSIAYNMPGVFELEGVLDMDALSKSFEALIERHESLRTVFRETADGMVMQLVLTLDALAFHIDFHDLRKEEDAAIRQVVEGSLFQPFDLSNGPLLRAALYQSGDNKWIFSYAMHHIISDGWSMDVLIKELLQLYHAYVQGQPNPLSPLRIHYKDYAVWQQQQLTAALSEPHKNYWLEQLSGELPVLELPADKIRPAIKTHNGASLTRQIDAATTAGLKALCQSADSTLFMGLLAGVKALLYRYTGQEDMIIGSPVAGREHSDLEDQIGFYVNTLALRTQFSGTDSYQQLLSKVKQVTLDAYQHQSYPFDELVDALPLHRDMSRSALFDVLVVLQHESGSALLEKGFSGLQVKACEGMRELCKFDLQFNFTVEQDVIAVKITYNSDIYHQDTIAQLSDHLEQLLKAIIVSPAVPIAGLQYLSAAEQQTISNFNGQPAPAVAGTLAATFRRQAAQTPDNIALVFEQTRLTYQELDRASEKLAAYLRDTYQLKADDLVGIQLDRSEWMIIALWGILKAGAAFVPIDQASPRERIDYIVKDSRCKVVLDERELDQFRVKEDQYIIEALPDINTPDDLAYVIYTSGSTGRPKGVMISHEALHRYITTIGEAYGIGEQERIIQVSNFAFDAAVEQIMLSLLHGASLYVISQAMVTDTPELTAYIANNGITHLHTVPTLLQHIDFTTTVSLKRVVSAGEPCPISLLQQIGDKITFYNKYGPTEATISATLYRSTDKLPQSTTIPIGHPLSNSRVYILNEQGDMLPLGVAGEICIGGPSLARGYLNQQTLTAERFVPDPYHPGQRMYRTGDLGKWLPDGNIVFLGRKDDQVKIRGHRIEPGEIAQVLQEHPCVAAAIVTAVKDNSAEQALAAYIVPAAELNIPDIRRWLASKLPYYMLPAYLIQLDALPLLPNGKLNIKALPAPEAMALSDDADYVAPRNATEIQLMQIWQDILGKEQIGIKDNFFELGGHSLKATRLASQLYKVFSVRPGLKELFIASTIEAQAAVIAQMQQSAYVSIPPATVQEHYPLSSAQRRLWVLSQFEEGSVAYNMQAVFEFEGALDRESLSRSFNTLIDRHESLRTVFRETADGEIRQYILTGAALGFKISYHDQSEAGEGAININQAVQTSLSQPFDLSNGPLLRAGLYQTGADKWIVTYVMHHIISDGWSMEVLIKELLQLYHAYVQDQPNPLSPLRIHYKDYAVWQQQQLTAALSDPHKNYWLKQLGGELPVLELPADKIRPAIKTYNGTSLTRQIDAGTIAGLKALCQSSHSTLFMGLVAAVNALLYRYTDQEDMIIGSPVAGREHSDLEDQIGFYVNTLALRTQFSGTDSYQQLLSKVKQVTLDAYEHQSYPFDTLVEELPLQRDMSRSALFDVLVVLQHQSSTSLVEKGLTELQVRTYEGLQQGSKFDLQFFFVEAGDQLQLQLNYNSDIYYNTTIERLACHLEQLLQAIIATPGKAIGTLAYLSLSEQTRLLEAFNATAEPYALGKTVVDLFAEQVKLTPEHVAVKFEDQTYTYTTLDQLSNQLAAYLADRYAIGVNDLVGIQLERSERMPLSVMAILKAGAAYVPIGMDYPAERVAYIIKDARLKVLINEEELSRFFSVQDQYSKEIFPLKPSPGDLAYCIYTSGSTGTPKGVLNSHEGLYNRLLWMKDYLDVTESEVFLQKTPYTFDVSVWELLLPFMTGSMLVMAAPEKHKDAAYLQDVMATEGVTIAHFVPSMLGVFLLDVVAEKCTGLHHIVCSGEELPATMVVACRNKLSGTRIHNLYGPTEAAIDVTAIDLTDVDVMSRGVSIGRPVANTRIYIVNESMQLQPQGVPGELLISGVQVARGYLHLEELTAARFIPDPFMSGNRVYRTGDIARWLPDGTIQYLGRRDDQVKIRGNRIELGEVEKALSSFGGIDQGIAAVKEVQGEKVLVAYLAARFAIDVNALRSHISTQLPDYMLPGYYVQLESLPLTSNGKVDKKRLPLPEGNSLSSGSVYEAPRNATELQLVGIWQDLLGKEQIGVKDNFFELGGHSLKATRLASQLYKVFNVKIGLKELFSASTIAAQAVLIGQAQQSRYVSVPSAPVQPYYPLSSSQRRLWVLSQFEEGSIAYNMPGVFELEGVLDMDALSKSFETLIERHESLRTVFRETADGAIRQYVLPVAGSEFKMGYHDLREEGEAGIKQAVQTSLSLPFDLSNGPLLRAALYQSGDNKWIFSYAMHHIISDGWSMEVLIKELLQLYHAYVEGQPNPLSPIRIHYKDYAVWQQQQLQEAAFQQHKQYWLEQFSGELPVLELPADKARPVIKTYHGASLYKQMDAGITTGLKALCQSADSTLFMGLLAGVKALLYRYTGQEDMIIGSPVAGREHSDLEDQIGFYVNTLALRTQFSGTDSYQQLLSKVKQVTLDAYQHQSYPFDELVDALPLHRDMSRSALFDVLVVLQHESGGALLEKGLTGLQVSPYEGLQPGSKFDLQFSFVEAGDQLQLQVNYNSDIYYNTTIERLACHLEQLLAAVIAAPQTAIGTLSYLSLSEQTLLLEEFNATAVHYDADKTTVALFEEQAKCAAGKIALLYEDRVLTYGELYEQSTRLAAYLHHVYNIGAGDLVGIQMERSEWLIISLLGVLKSGAAYVPIDPGYPQDRIDYIVADSQCKVVLDERELDQFRANADNYSIENPVAVIRPTDLAYVIYTSGSTGRPKGVMITHSNVYAFMEWCKEEFSGSGYEVVLGVTSICFDLSVFEIFYTLVSGKQLRLLADALSIPQYLDSTLPLLLNTVPSVVSSLLSTGADMRQVSVLNMAGEPVPAHIVSQLDCDRMEVRNLYGPSEDTTYSTVYRLKNDSNILIGRPVSNTRIYILNDHGSLQPVGIPGEICISGAGLARGYLNQAGLTSEKFVSHPFRAGERLYKTGDLGKWQPDGNIVFLGRKDDQVKIRGYRVELGEISQVLQDYAGVSEALVTAVKDSSGDQLLAAYVVCTTTPDIADMRSWLGLKLPHYMVPAHFIQLDALPLLPNGKLNKKALPAPEGPAQRTAYVAPRNQVEEQLVQIWQQILGLEQVGVQHNFFELGGHSLKATRLVSQVQKEFGVNVNIKDVFMNPTIETVGELVRAGIWLERSKNDSKEDRTFVEI